MEGRANILGTPLSKYLDTTRDDHEGPTTSRRNRKNQRQIVVDEQGRRRFHGAFTGGFSAGYYNTVDTVEGFKPKTFVTRRHERDDDSTSHFSHKPEDYMDQEDFEEFGIAPHKINVQNQYYKLNHPFTNPAKGPSCHPGTLKLLRISVGEKILSSLDANFKRIRSKEIVSFCDKNDFYGLGYEPLQKIDFEDTSKPRSSNKITATFSGGERLGISGQAFGSGIIDDDEDYTGCNDIYGYENMADLRRSVDEAQEIRMPTMPRGRDTVPTDDMMIPGFIESRKSASRDTSDLTTESSVSVPHDWVVPRRSESPVSAKIVQKAADSFRQRFTTSSASLAVEEKSLKPGLLNYSDFACLKTEPSKDDRLDSQTSEVTVSRHIVAWIPSESLCKLSGIVPPIAAPPIDVLTEVDEGATPDPPKLVPIEIAPIDLRRNIFDTSLFDNSSDDAEFSSTSNDIGEDEAGPNAPGPSIVQMCSNAYITVDTISSSSSDVCEIQTQKSIPEVITIDSSSSDTSGAQQSVVRAVDFDSYGPSLPPTYSGEDGHPKQDSGRRKRKKLKKHKRHKRGKG